MTFSLLARDPDTGALGGAAATGNLCVGAWVLRGKAGVGISASQGRFPSTPWGENVLVELANGKTAEQAIQNTVLPDAGRNSRQLLALGNGGFGAGFSGLQNMAHFSTLIRPGLCAGGNMLSRTSVVEATADGFASYRGSFLRRLMAGLTAGAKEGGDARGLMSAALLIIAEDHPPIDIRIDYAIDPLAALSDLATRVEEREYARWMKALPISLVPRTN